VSAEAVPIVDHAGQALLLHFWPLTTLIFVPQFVDGDGQSYLGKRTKSDKQRHFSVTVPEVRDLLEFIQAYPKLLDDLKIEARANYLPAQAIVDLPAESALAYSDRLAILTAKSLEAGELQYSISSVEYQHLVKEGNNVKAVGAGRVVPNRRLVAEYHALVNPRAESTRYRNPLFRRGLLVALLHGDPHWFRPFGKTFKDFDCELFVRQLPPADGDERGPPSFHIDSAKKLRDETKLHAQFLERLKTMPNAERPATPLPVLVDKIVRTYLFALTEAKPGLSLQKYRDAEGRLSWDEIPRETRISFDAAKRDIAESLFYEFRSRRDQAFVELFRSRMFAPKQFLTESDRLELASVMINYDRLDDLKTLTLLALSANS
jgi:CRISPR-associated protein Cmx8